MITILRLSSPTLFDLSSTIATSSPAVHGGAERNKKDFYLFSCRLLQIIFFLVMPIYAFQSPTLRPHSMRWKLVMLANMITLVKLNRLIPHAVKIKDYENIDKLQPHNQLGEDRLVT